MLARLLAHPANDLHPAIDSRRRHQLLPTQVVIEMDFVPAFFELVNAVDDGFHPDRLRVLGQKDLGAARVVVQKQQPRRRRLGLARRALRDGQLRKPAVPAESWPPFFRPFWRRKGNSWDTVAARPAQLAAVMLQAHDHTLHRAIANDSRRSSRQRIVRNRQVRPRHLVQPEESARDASFFAPDEFGVQARLSRTCPRRYTGSNESLTMN